MKYRDMFSTRRLELYATGPSNWDIYKTTSAGGRAHLVALAKPNSGANDSYFGPLDHLDRLTRQGINHGYTRITEQKTA